MNKFKKGDIVKVIDNKGLMESVIIGATGEVLSISTQAWEPLVQVKLDNGSIDWIYERRLAKPTKEENMFDMKKESWYIQINNEREFLAAEEWLLQNFGAKLGLPYRNERVALTNTMTNGCSTKEVMYTTDLKILNHKCQEIVLNYKFVVEAAFYPEVSQAQKTLDELQKQIEDLQAKAKQLQEEISK